MIYIIDNGKDYSDHTLCFVELGSMPAALFEECLKVFAELEKPYPSAPHVVAVAERFDWRTPDALLPVDIYLDLGRFWYVLSEEDPTCEQVTRGQAAVLFAAIPYLESSWLAAIEKSRNGAALKGISWVRDRLKVLTTHPIVPALED